MPSGCIPTGGTWQYFVIFSNGTYEAKSSAAKASQKPTWNQQLLLPLDLDKVVPWPLDGRLACRMAAPGGRSALPDGGGAQDWRCLQRTGMGTGGEAVRRAWVA